MSKHTYDVVELGNAGWLCDGGKHVAVKVDRIDVESLTRGATVTVTIATKDGERPMRLTGVHAFGETRKTGKRFAVCTFVDGWDAPAPTVRETRKVRQASAPVAPVATVRQAPARQAAPTGEVAELRDAVTRLAEQVATMARMLAERQAPAASAPVTVRAGKPRTPAQVAATERMLAGRKRAAMATTAAIVNGEQAEATKRARKATAPAATTGECGICGGPTGGRGYRHVAAPDVVACNDCLDLSHEEVRELVGQARTA